MATYHSATAQRVVTATVTPEVALTSQLQLGVSHTNPGLINYDSSSPAVKRARQLLSDASTYQNTHIMGWGLLNPNPLPGQYDWQWIDQRMALLDSSDAPVITLCAAPDWMKVADFPLDDPDSYYPDDDHTNWDLIEKAPLPEYYDDFAHLAAEVARRYPRVKHFQVWNEFKGFWSEALNNWDYVAYTKLYNTVYDSLKAVNPDLQIGGGYLVIQGTGSATFGKEGRDTHVPISEKDQEVLAYWLANQRGADFICIDRGVVDYHDPNKETYTWEEKISLMYLWEKVGKEVQELVEASDTPDLPIWWSEYYGDTGEEGSQELAAAYATIYHYMIRGGASVALLWNPMEGEVPHYLFTQAVAGGAQPTPHYQVFKDVYDYFEAGTDILKTTSDDPAVSVLASPKKTMLINAKQEPIVVQLNGTSYSLEALEVKLIDTPAPEADELVIPVAVEATSFQSPNRPENTLDGDLATRWSAQGKGEAIVYDVGQTVPLTAVDIKFQYSDRRRASFTLAASEDKDQWTTVYEGESSGSASDFEAFRWDATPGRYLRLLGRDNSTNNGWTSVQEVRIKGTSASNLILGNLRTTLTATGALEVYPNPVTDRLYVKITDEFSEIGDTPPRGGSTAAKRQVKDSSVRTDAGATEVQVLNLFGVPLLQQALDAAGEVDVSALPPGMYIVNVIRNNIRKQQTKIIKQ